MCFVLLSAGIPDLSHLSGEDHRKGEVIPELEVPDGFTLGRAPPFLWKLFLLALLFSTERQDFKFRRPLGHVADSIAQLRLGRST